EQALRGIAGAPACAAGMLSLDDSVAAYWPEYGQRGKGAITVRHVLQHRAGVPVAGSLLRTVLHMSNWDLSVRDAEQTRARWAAALSVLSLLLLGVLPGWSGAPGPCGAGGCLLGGGPPPPVGSGGGRARLPRRAVAAACAGPGGPPEGGDHPGRLHPPQDSPGR